MTAEAITHAISRVNAVGATRAMEGVGVLLDDHDVSCLAPALAVLIEGRPIEAALADTLAVGIAAGIELAEARALPSARAG